MTDGKYLFDQPVKIDMRTYNNIRKIATGQGDDYISGCSLDYIYFKNYYKMVEIDLSKQQNLDADPKVEICNKKWNRSNFKFLMACC